MIIAGIDYNTAGEHWAILDSADAHLIALFGVPYPKLRDLAKRLAMRDKVPAILYYQQPAPLPYSSDTELQRSFGWIAIEGYVHHYDKQGKLAGVHWYIRAAYAEQAVLPISPHRWKAEIGLPGAAGKEAIKAFIIQLYPQLPANLAQDCYDAIGIARAAVRILNAG